MRRHWLHTPQSTHQYAECAKLGNNNKNQSAEMNFRNFTLEVEAIASAWRASAISDTPWQLDGKPGEFGGQASGYRVKSGTVVAFAKPSMFGNEAPPVPRAAHEKIAADLAYDLTLPLPPAILHSWTTVPEGTQESNVALSLWPFLTVHKWQHVASTPACDQTKLDLRLVSSALSVFDTWVDNRDRHNAGNLLISGDAEGAKQMAYIDYSYSLAYGWRSGFEQVNVCHIYPTDKAHADAATMDNMVRRIEAMSDSAIDNIVTRVPDHFLPNADKILISDGLKYRKLKLREPLRAAYGAPL